jgi:hypothetical protein
MVINLFNVRLETDKREQINYIMKIYHNVNKSEGTLTQS